jgi:hypothetical protein
MSKAVFCIAKTESQTQQIVDRLKGAMFSPGNISVLFPDKGATRKFAYEKDTKAPEVAVAGATSGAALGAGAGWLLGMGALAIPGVGPFIAAGPIMAALSGAAVGGALGGLTGALIGMGIPEFEAKRYESHVKKGSILISVHSDNNDETTRARKIFEECGAEDISSAYESTPTQADKDYVAPVGSAL